MEGIDEGSQQPVFPQGDSQDRCQGKGSDRDSGPQVLKARRALFNPVADLAHRGVVHDVVADVGEERAQRNVPRGTKGLPEGLEKAALRQWRKADTRQARLGPVRTPRAVCHEQIEGPGFTSGSQILHGVRQRQGEVAAAEQGHRQPGLRSRLFLSGRRGLLHFGIAFVRLWRNVHSRSL